MLLHVNVIINFNLLLFKTIGSKLIFKENVCLTLFYDFTI